MNIEVAKKILEKLAEQGMSTICLCPGARNAPFVELLSQTSSFETISFFDERSAGFFALGRARRDKRPVGVFTTSGTAVAELLPSVIEASYTETPLVVVSSDRPKRLRGTGAPQAIEQSQIFSDYVESSLDFSGTKSVPEFELGNKPFHINICFDEPLVGPAVAPWRVVTLGDFKGSELTAQVPAQSLSRTLFTLGALNPDESKNIEKILSDLQIPVFAETCSGLKNSKPLSNLLIEGGERIVSQMLKSGEVESVVRIGDIPIGRYWRDLDFLNIPTISLSNKPWKGSEKSEIYHCNLTQIDFDAWNFEPWNWEHWKPLSVGLQKATEQLLVEFPKSEPTFFKKIESLIGKTDSLYLGNSLPVRIWDLVNSSSTPVRSNRGANGIDGQVSSAFGWMDWDSQNWVLLGDLTSLYDFNGFWVSDDLRKNQVDVNLLVLNNGGGKIFSRIFENKLFQNSHKLNFKGIAETWGWSYQNIKDPSELTNRKGLNLIEITPDVEQGDGFWKRYDSLWEN